MNRDLATRRWGFHALRVPALCLVLAATLTAHAGVVNLAQEPLYTTTSSSVKPNLMFILDNSGSMNNDYLPDEAEGNTSYGYWSAQCNGVAYDPATTYTIPVDANGDPLAAPSFTAACDNGFSGTCSVNLSNRHYYKYTGSQKPLSYQYDTNGVISTSTFYTECQANAVATVKVSGNSSTVVSGITVNGVQIMSGATAASSSSSTVASRIAAAITAAGYNATVSGSTVSIFGPASAASYTPVVSCTSCGMSFTRTAFPANGSFTKVTVGATSGIGGTDERQNYANWYSFYRKRLLMMKSATGLAFNKIGKNYRVGFSTISYTGTDSSNAGFLAIDNFITDDGDATHKTNFYSKLYGATGSSWTPLRGALAKAGRIYAGKLGDDPMQYSCQQNFTLLSTDGYWNTPDESSTYGPFGLDGVTAVGQRDGSSTPRPLNDGETTRVTQSTPTVTTSVVTTPRTVDNRSTRTDTTTTVTTQRRTNTYTRTRLTSSGSDACGGATNTRRRLYTGTTTETVTTTVTTSQAYQVDTTTAYSDAATTVTTDTRTVVTTNGVVTNDTTARTVSGPSTVSTITSGPTATTTAIGAPTSSTVGPTSTESPTAAVASISWSQTSDTCIATTASADTLALSGSGGWTTTTSGPTTTVGTPVVTAGYPQTQLGTSATVVTGPTQGTTTSNTSTVVGHPNTLADVAMYYYETDLRNPGNCTSGSETGANLCPTDSNGAYAPNVPGSGDDNNVRPHMTTFTLGLGVNGLLNYSSTYAKDTSGDFYSIRTGGKDWPDPDTSATSPYAGTGSSVIERIDDLWHAAVNGRGAYFSAKNPDSLVTSLNAALAGMSTRLGYGTSAATSNLAPILGDNSLFVASFTTAQWTGNLVAESIDINTGAINSTAAWCVENVAADTSNGIPACTGTLASQVGASSDSRTIYFNKSGTLTSFTYGNLPGAQQAYFDTSKLEQYGALSATDKALATGTTLINFLRGQTQYESQDGASASLYRDRKATLGDIVDTPPLFVGKPTFEYNDLGYNAWKNATAQQNRGATVFVGANDGMLHAFNATTGVERWAFVPTPVMPEMYRLADVNYTANHHNYVDGRLSYFDVCVKDCGDAALADWRTLLIGGLGSGGRGYFALDVTDPTAPKLLWEFTSLSDADLGYSFGNPLAVKKSDGSWVVLLTSGYDNVQLSASSPGPYDTDGSGRGFLFVLNPLTGAVIDKIEAKDGATLVGSKTSPSGLGRIASWADTPTLDATALYVYAGDLQGNLWRFDVNTNAVVRLATFTDSSANAQPITTRPELAKVNGYRIVYVSTGKYLEKTDLLSENFKTQSLYALADTGVSVASPRTTMVRQTLTTNKPNRTVSANAVVISPPTVNGWYLDFPDSGELSNIDMTLAQGTLLVPTNVPTNGVCEAGGYSWYNYFNYKTGSFVPGATTSAKWAGNDLTTGHNIIWIKGQPVVVRTGSGTAPRLLPGVPFNPGGASGVIGHRVSWREIIRK